MSIENDQTGCKLLYNTERKSLKLPEYGRNVQKMIEYVRSIPDRDKRNEQARAVVKVMETLNPQVHLQEDYEHKLWDHLHIISGFDLDIDSPYPVPVEAEMLTPPAVVPIKKKPIKATHYGRNIESIIDLIAETEDGESKTAMIRSLAIYMRQQYLIWNKDSVADETIFQDIEKLSDYRIKVPEGIQLTRISSDATFSRPSLNPNVNRMKNNHYQRNNNMRRNNNNQRNK
ncbi:MAG: DUF4290 domain-containing protein [Bacteroidales bacterium]|nr:DUF4290 domain-containing protein [Bacteroides sp.]MCM1197755.1 DUF4290 domain-containing protein [Clostridium sp.]MCM1501578.1 DUF4290 domain-containing protein [Bacteroidales bacterium]